MSDKRVNFRAEVVALYQRDARGAGPEAARAAWNVRSLRAGGLADYASTGAVCWQCDGRTVRGPGGACRVHGVA